MCVYDVLTICKIYQPLAPPQAKLLDNAFFNPAWFELRIGSCSSLGVVCDVFLELPQKQLTLSSQNNFTTIKRNYQLHI